jgi:hypothetical protein
MKSKALKWFDTLLLLFITVNISCAQKIEPVYSRQIQYTIIKGKPKYSDQKQAVMIKSSMSDIRYALSNYLGERIWYRSEMRVEQSNIKFYIDEKDSLMTTVYSIGFNKGVDGRVLNEYKKISFPPSIIPEDNYMLWKNPKALIIVSFFFNMASTENSEDDIRKQKKLELIQNWIKEL